MFEGEKLSGLNFNDWFRSLKLVLKVEKKLYVIEQPIPPAPAIGSIDQAFMKWSAVYDAHNEVDCLMLGSMTPKLHRQFENSSPYDMIQELKSMFEKQVRVERFDLIQTFHACKQEEGKSVGSFVIKMKGDMEQLERLRKGKGKGKGKDKLVYAPKPKNPKPSAKEHPSKDDACHHYKEVGHWKRNCLVYLAELMKKKKNTGSVSSSGYPKETMGYCFYFPYENKIVVARYAEFLEKSLIFQKAIIEVEEKSTNLFKVMSSLRRSEKNSSDSDNGDDNLNQGDASHFGEDSDHQVRVSKSFPFEDKNQNDNKHVVAENTHSGVGSKSLTCEEVNDKNTTSLFTEIVSDTLDEFGTGSSQRKLRGVVDDFQLLSDLHLEAQVILKARGMFHHVVGGRSYQTGAFILMDADKIRLLLKDQAMAQQQQVKTFHDQIAALHVELQTTQGLIQTRQGGGDLGSPIPRSMRLDVPKFSGSDPESWIFSINEYFTLLATPADQRLRIVGFNLEGVRGVGSAQMKLQVIDTWDGFLEERI
ncbi:helitron helicase-like domain-containing protein [Tanacetum coccineum]